MTLDALCPGVLFADRYRVVRSIARGGMGAVYEVVHLETQRRRALKVILPGLLDSEDLRQRFRQEAQVAARIDSEFVVDVFDAGVDDATRMPFLVMELLRGEELGARLKRVGRLAPVEVVAHLHQTALALDRMRAANVVHRDLKPENLFIIEREDGPSRIKVLDLGIAKILAEGGAESQATRGLGTPLYMAPEQLESASHVTPATDIYAIGMIAYTLLVGCAYFTEESRASGNILAFALAARRGPIEPAGARAARAGASLPPAFNAWFGRATALDPRSRFVSAVTAVSELAVVLGVTTPSAVSMRVNVEANPPGTPAPLYPTAGALSSTGSPANARRASTPIALLATGLILIGAVAFVTRVHRAEAPPPGTAAAAASTSEVAPRASIEVPPMTPMASASTETRADVPDAGATDAGTQARPLSRPSSARPVAPAPEGPTYSRD